MSTPTTTKGLLAWLKDACYPQSLDPEYSGSCPCFHAELVLDGHPVSVHGRCWRVSELSEVQDLYVWGDLPLIDLHVIGEAIRPRLDEQQWYCPYRVLLRPFDWSLG